MSRRAAPPQALEQLTRLTAYSPHISWWKRSPQFAQSGRTGGSISPPDVPFVKCWPPLHPRLCPG